VAEATLASLKLVRREEWRREHLRVLIKRFRTGAEQLGLQLMDSPTPIQPLLAGESSTAVAMSKALEARGILISAIRPPTVPDGSARLRITFSAAHKEEHVDLLLIALYQAHREIVA
jgi:8-amino-7-oxononanoate synthase